MFHNGGPRTVPSDEKQHTEAEARTCAATNVQALSRQCFKLSLTAEISDVHTPTDLLERPMCCEPSLFASKFVGLISPSKWHRWGFNRPFIETDRDNLIYRLYRCQRTTQCLPVSERRNCLWRNHFELCHTGLVLGSV